MKKIIYIILVATIFTSCEVDHLNKDPKTTPEAPGSTLMSSAQRELFRALNTPNVNINNYRLFIQHWTEVTYIQEEQYKIQRQIPENLWEAFYKDVIKDLDEATKNIENEEVLNDNDQGIKTNQLAIIELQTILTYQYLVDMFGNVPYTESLDITNVTPKYDDAEAIYNDLIERLNTALSNLNTDYGTGDFTDQDLVYHGDISKWIAFGNALKLKFGMTLADFNPDLSKTLVEEAAPNVFVSNEGNFAFQYLGTLPNTNPVWENIVYSNRDDFVPAKTYIDKVNELEDPRRTIFFSTVNGKYIGGINGETIDDYNSVSHLGQEADGSIFRDPQLEGLIYSAAEVNFYLAEAAERGYSVGGNAKDFYTAAIRSNMEYWGVSQADIDTYLSNPAVDYDSAAGDYKQKIGDQKWVILFNRGYEAWTEYRRLDYPQLIAPETAELDQLPTRMIYPRTEQNQNGDNYNEASSAIGGDQLDTKLFWDVN
ncbi:SusD/RagB family nutrient-binding outer membrane lipoprotein [Sinomicrobium weinanense]|uniref:SusD/RagB family nutrient-binding outer membrane lipoprotein n=1 Tax=Sinomicrobium weinanense TaxID=2842200 RepID=A0A926Q328_9FLAO|nr:SusD/RagB family nutrient-binding outer membrane lipoprotein [Sinomicrobium weinanense]MBC9795566.1 SusD/RagB family nutrient-binding outer membrane lipoprotein [Sinomicrobium weinanense]MBU3124587.1 SusD/RagB family nutrient-binding outer membrane lipoprotein [Sinomicrobium weinanense]